MLRLTPPAVITAGKNRARTAHPRSSTRRHTAPTSEIVRPNDLGLGQLFFHTRDAIVVGDLLTGRIALWNPAAERLFGWTAAEAVGQPIEILIPPPIIRLHQQGLSLYRHTGQGTIVNSGAPVEVPALTNKGEPIRVELSLAALEHTSGTSRYVMAMLRDTSERRRADLQGLEAARAATSRDEALQALREHQQLVQDGLSIIQRELGCLERSVRRVKNGMRARVVEARTLRVRRMLEEIATSAALQAGVLELHPERVNLVPLVGRVVSDVRSRGTACKINVALPQGLTALVDRGRIEQVIRTLLELAITRNPRGCWIDVELRRPLAGLARIEVRDVGRPISEQLRQRLTDLSLADQGLTLCRSIVELHGGTLAVEFPTEGGVRVVVRLPTQRGRVLEGPPS